MNKLVFFLLLLPQLFWGQAISFEVGAVSSSYYYKNSNNEKLTTLDPGRSTGVALMGYKSLGYQRDANSIKFGLRYQQLNARGYVVDVPLNYQTQFLSLSGAYEANPYTIYVNEYCANCVKIRVITSLGAEVAKIFSGTQKVGNQETYRLVDEPEFNGLLYGPVGAAGLEVDLFNSTTMLLNYHYTYFFNSHSAPERVFFGRSMLSVGIKSAL
jgi:hypothetical protein